MRTSAISAACCRTSIPRAGSSPCCRAHQRFVELSASPVGFYASFASWSVDRLEAFARGVWESINEPNVVDHVLPNRDRVDVVITKGPDHAVTAVTLRD